MLVRSRLDKSEPNAPLLIWLPIQKRAWSNGVTRYRRRDACNDWLTEQIRPPAVQYAWVIIRNGTGMNHIRDVLSHHSLFRQANPAFPSKATIPFPGVGLLGPFFFHNHATFSFDFFFRLSRVRVFAVRVEDRNRTFLLLMRHQDWFYDEENQISRRSVAKKFSISWRCLLYNRILFCNL